MKLMCPRCSDSENAGGAELTHQIKRRRSESDIERAHLLIPGIVDAEQNRGAGAHLAQALAIMWPMMPRIQEQVIWYDLMLCFERVLLLTFELHWLGSELQVAALLYG